jgi:hypothetical protein
MERTFAILDRLDVPDLSRDVDRRRTSDEERRLIPEPPRNGRRVIAAVLAVAVFSAAAAFGFRVWTRHQEVRPIGDAWSWAGQDWTRIADPPERFEGATWIWAGDHLIAWGGCTDATGCSPTNEGFSYDPRTQLWTPMPGAPRPGTDGAGVAVGDRAYFFDEGRVGQVFDTGATAWHELPIAPVEPDFVIWAGVEIIALQAAGRTEGGSAAAAFDPGTNTWRSLPQPPTDFNVASITWNGQAVIVLSALLDRRNEPASPTVDAMTLDPATQEWRSLPKTALYPGSFASAWVGDRLVAWDYDMKWQSLDLVSDGWSSRRDIPLEFSECYVGGATVGSIGFAWNCGQAATFESGHWTEVRGGPLEDMIHSQAYERDISLWRFADLVPAGDVLVLPMTGITLAPSGEACYGCPGSPQSLWVYRPT